MEFNKMFVMLPVMFAARQIDGENPTVIYWLRIAYGSMQFLCIMVVLYTYSQASKVASTHDGVVYVPPPPTPFSDPNATKKKYTETTYGAHVMSTARSLVGSTLFGVCLTVGLHIYKGMVVGLAIQTVMGPFNLAENPLVKALLFGTGIRPQNKIFEEKIASELTAEDEVVDESGNAMVRSTGASTNNKVDHPPSAAEPKEKKVVSLEGVMLDTWDAGAKADITNLMSVLNSKNCNYQTQDDQWSAIMILSGLKIKGTPSAIRQAMSLGANPAICDKEGWNALHWAAFHGSPDAATELCKEGTLLLQTVDKEGLTPLQTARKEKNDDVAKVLVEAMARLEISATSAVVDDATASSAEADAAGSSAEADAAAPVGLRKRK